MEQSFYQALYADDNFAMAVGRLTLSSAKLESSISSYIQRKGVASASDKAPLGSLLKTLLEKHTIDRTAGEHLQFILHQRNYFVHKLHANLIEYPSDKAETQLFVNRATALSKEMEYFSSLLTSAE